MRRFPKLLNEMQLPLSGKRQLLAFAEAANNLERRRIGSQLSLPGAVALVIASVIWLFVFVLVVQHVANPWYLIFSLPIIVTMGMAVLVTSDRENPTAGHDLLAIFLLILATPLFSAMTIFVIRPMVERWDREERIKILGKDWSPEEISNDARYGIAIKLFQSFERSGYLSRTDESLKLIMRPDGVTVGTIAQVMEKWQLLEALADNLTRAPIGSNSQTLDHDEIRRLEERAASL